VSFHHQLFFFVGDGVGLALGGLVGDALGAGLGAIKTG